MSKKVLVSIFLILCICASACGKKNTKEKPEELEAKIHFSDSLGKEVIASSAERVVILYGSYAETWLLAGGSLLGTTEDAVSERGLKLEENVSVVGTVKEPNLELVLSLNPDLVILSADIASQVELDNSLTQMGIAHAYFRVDTFDDYLSLLRICCDITDREDLYQKNGVQVQEKINSILKHLPNNKNKSVLLLRAYSTGAKAKTDDNFTGSMLVEMGTQNIALKYPSLLEEISMETILTENPDFIFVTTMGEEEKALLALKNTIETDPAWGSLKAVKEEHYIVLPKELFHYKPNAKWAESYEYLARIIYPEQFEDK